MLFRHKVLSYPIYVITVLASRSPTLFWEVISSLFQEYYSTQLKSSRGPGLPSSLDLKVVYIVLHSGRADATTTLPQQPTQAPRRHADTKRKRQSGAGFQLALGRMIRVFPYSCWLQFLYEWWVCGVEQGVGHVQITPDCWRNLSASKLRRQTEQKEQPWANDSFFLTLDKETDYEEKEKRTNSPGLRKGEDSEEG